MELTLIGMLYGLGCFVFVLALKWLFLFRYQTCTKPMWTPFRLGFRSGHQPV